MADLVLEDMRPSYPFVSSEVETPFVGVRLQGLSTALEANGLEQCEGKMAHPERFERPTPRFVVWCSIQLSYGCVEACQ